MKRYALYHIEEELYLNEYPDCYELDANVCLFTKGEIEYIFENKDDKDNWDEETLNLDDGTECHKSEFEIVEYRVSEMKRSDFNDFKF